MRLVLALIIIVYLVGVGVVLFAGGRVGLEQRNRLGVRRQYRPRPA
ncbi:hypothetical protein [Roseiarcus sp.]